MRSLTKVIIVSSAVLAVGVLQAESIDVKTGQWETTMVMQMSGMPQIDTSKMPPDVRARVEQAMKAQQQPHTSKTCVTQENLDKGWNVGNDQPNCKRTLVSNSRTVTEMKMECTAQGKQPASSFDVRIEALSRESVKGTIKSTSGNGMTMNGNFTSKWIGPCPDAK